MCLKYLMDVAYYATSIIYTKALERVHDYRTKRRSREGTPCSSVDPTRRASPRR